MVRKVAISGIAALFCVISSVISPPVLAEVQPPVQHGRAALLMDVQTGQVLFEQNGFARNFPASTTKMLTALVAVEHGNLDQIIQVSSQAVDLGPDSSSCYLSQGDAQPLKLLLYGLLLPSGNDCAVAIAEGITGGHVDQFVGWMNETAKRLGATQSHFTNPHGLHDPNHYTTAYDLALITRSALSNPTIKNIASAKELFWPGKSEQNGIYYNHNSMLFTYEGTVGGKTGFTEEAGHTLAHGASRNGRFLVGVEMGEDATAVINEDMTALLDYGFAQFDQKPVLSLGAPLGTVPVEGGEAREIKVAAQGEYLAYVVKNGKSNVSLKPVLPSKLEAPVADGQKVGVVEIHDGDRVLGTVDVVTLGSIAASARTWDTLQPRLLTATKWLVIVAGLILLLRIVARATRRALRRSRRGQYARRRTVKGTERAISSYRTHT